LPGDGNWPYDNSLTNFLPQAEADIADLVKLAIQPFIAVKIRNGPHDPAWLVPLLTHLSPNTVRRLMADRNNPGLYEPDAAARERWVRIAAWAHEAEIHDKTLDEFNGYFVVRSFGGKPRVCWWDDRGVFHQQSVRDFKTAHGEKKISWVGPDGEDNRVPLPGYWLDSPKTPRFERVEFLPGQKVVPTNVMNLWRGWLLPDWEVDNSPQEPIGCERFLEHIRTNICRGNEGVYSYLLGWMADAIQNAHRTSEVAVVLRGPQGSGKTFFAERFLEFFSPHTLVLNRPGQLTGNFNAHLLDKSMLFADEAFFAGHRQDANSLKTLITSGEIFIEPKGVNGFMAPKRFRLIISSNDEHVVRAEADDRRFLVLEVDAGEHNQNREYFAKIMQEWRTGGREALFKWLRGAYWRKKLETDWDVGNRPRTAALNRQKDLSLPKAARAVHNMLLAGEVPCDFHGDGERVFVATRLLAEAERLGQTEETALGDKLRMLAGGRAANERRYLGVGSARRQHRGFWLPTLTECRRRWEEHLRRSVEWPADVSTWALSEPPPEDPF
jgi:hypothetical protein